MGSKEQQRSHIYNNVDFYCGWCAGCIETIILFPQSKLIFRQQLFGLAVKDAVTQLKSEGMGLLYRGLLPPLIMRTSTRSIMFGAFDKYKGLLNAQDRPGIASSLTKRHAVAAFLAGCTEATLCPLERIQVLLQTHHYHGHFKNTKEAIKYVYGFGIHEFYRGLSLVVLRNGLSNSLFFTLREPLRLLFIEKLNLQKSSMSAATFISNFVSGAILGASISTLFFPVNVVKHRLQSELGTTFQSPIRVFRMVWEERNRSLKGLFRGVQMNFTRSLIAWGITNSVYEFLLEAFR
ncbi:unnamed protein product [Bursaphelenchus okinawaensis]|uniref:Mitochondrial carrier protein n=1 Tax=Bursaphelenchus okinawaensis TaxID=465554 RepID=A0A811LNJ0_9BILA|nr:unnamed protein product [Bursaphelenchus okinawaensis]CAG9127135.1 unnamed protein product [Bursaphelenchus okinawaensis]